MPARRYLLALIVAAPALGQDPMLSDGVRLRLGTDKFRETDRINAVALSPDGKRVAIASSGQTVRILDVATGAELRRYPLRESLRTPELLFTPDGKQLVTSGYNGVNLWDADSGRLSAPSPTSRPDLGDNPIRLSPDGKAVIVGSQTGKGKVRIINLDSGPSSPPSSRSTPQTPRGRCRRTAAWSPFGASTLPSTRDLRTVQLFDAKTGAEKKLETNADPCLRRVLTGRTKLATGGGRGSFSSGTSRRRRPKFRSRATRAGRTSPSRPTASSCPRPARPAWSNMGDGDRGADRDLQGPVPVVFGLQYRPDGQLLAWARRANTSTFGKSRPASADAGRRALPRSRPHFGPDADPVFTSDGETLRWDVATGKELGPFELKGATAPAVGPRQTGRSSSAGRQVRDRQDAAVLRPAVWDVAPGGTVRPEHVGARLSRTERRLRVRRGFEPAGVRPHGRRPATGRFRSRLETWPGKSVTTLWGNRVVSRPPPSRRTVRSWRPGHTLIFRAGTPPPRSGPGIWRPGSPSRNCHYPPPTPSSARSCSWTIACTSRSLRPSRRRRCTTLSAARRSGPSKGS